MNFVKSLATMLCRRRATPLEILAAVLLLLVSSAHIGDKLAASSHSWWMRFGVLPAYTYISGLLFPTILLINTYIVLNDLPITPSTLLRNTRLTWPYMASLMFYQNLARQSFRLTLWSLGAASAALPTWLWWIDAVAKPIRLAIHLLLLHQEMVWAVCLAILALSLIAGVSQQVPVTTTIPSGFWFDTLPWTRLAEAVVREDRATGFFLTCCFACVRAVYNGVIAGMIPTVLRHVLPCAGAIMVISVYTQFTFTNIIKQHQNGTLAAEVGNLQLQTEPPTTATTVEVQLPMHYRGFRV